MTTEEVKQENPWLTEELLQKILQSDSDITEKSAKIGNVSCGPATNKGDNYSSEMYRVSVQYTFNDNSKSKQKSYVVKCMHPLHTDVGKMLKLSGVFDKEVSMYSESLIKIEDTIKLIGDTLDVGPKLICWSSEPYELLIIEDLRPEGFRMPDRRHGLDKKHCDMVFTKLAKMHAASMYLNRKNPQFRKNYNKGAFNDDMSEMMKTYFKNGIIEGTNVMRKIPSLQKYVKFYEQYTIDINDDGMKLLTPVPEDCFNFNVLTHGDLWLNNMMFKYNSDDEPIDVKFVDFQMSTFGCPGLDINYFFFTSPTEDTRAKYRDDILSNYQSILSSTLNKLRYDAMIPNKDDLYNELFRAKGICLMTVCIVLPIVKLDKETSTDITTEDLMDSIGSESRNNIYSNILYEKALEVAVKYLDEIGYIDKNMIE